jgi:hypothetical protein
MVLNRYREAIQSGKTVRWEEVSVYPAGERVGEVAVTPLYLDIQSAPGKGARFSLIVPRRDLTHPAPDIMLPHR